MIGFIGLGIMGKPMAENLLKAGYPLMVYDRNEKPVADLCSRGAAKGTPADIGKSCSVVFTILPNGAIVKDVLFGEGGVASGMEAGGIVCDMSSVTPVESQFCWDTLRKQGIGFVDAPVSGGEPGAIQGTLAFMAGGAEEDFEALKPYFAVMGASALRIGESGSGSVTKLANQVIVNMTIASISEAFVLAVKAGADPEKESVEINVRRRCFFPADTGINYITVSGFVLCKAATTWAPPTAFQDGMIGPHWSRGWIIENCEIADSKCSGISLGKKYQPENDNKWTRGGMKDGSQTEREVICLSLKEGWNRENTGSHIIRNCEIHDCGQAGIVGHLGCVFSLIENNSIHHINTRRELIGSEIGGIKLHAAIDTVIRNNRIHHCTRGIWLDWQAQGTRISRNLLHDNYIPDGSIMPKGAMQSQDIFIEVSHGPTLIDHNIMLSKVSARIATQGTAFVHNLIAGSFTAVGSGTDNLVDGKNQPRYTPYHIRHRTEVAGFMSILHGDNRIYNNIFIQNWPVEEQKKRSDMGVAVVENKEVGTAVFEDYPTYEEWIDMFDLNKPADMFKLMSAHFSRLPVWIYGNVYFNGAKACSKEKAGFSDTEHKGWICLLEEDDGYRLKTNVIELLEKVRVGIINSDILGYAFEPEQRFENPDGSDIVFDKDFLGVHRGVETIPGPFAEAAEISEILF